MAIALSAQSLVAAPINNFSLVTANVTGTSADNSSQSTVRINSASTIIANQVLANQGAENRTIQPEPVIRVNDQGNIESPYIDITQNLTERQSISGQKILSAQPADSNLQQIKSLTEQQQNIQARKETLADQQFAIEQQINQLQRKELEINRKRFQLQQQSHLGQFVNFQI